MPHPLASTSLTVLVADDDPVVTDLLDRFFGERGHTVHPAPDAAHAVELSSRMRFDAALVDVNMPGGGQAVVEALAREGCLDGPLLVMTGDREADLGGELPVAEVVRKPFRFAALVERVEELALASRGSGPEGNGGPGGHPAGS